MEKETQRMIDEFCSKMGIGTTINNEVTARITELENLGMAPEGDTASLVAAMIYTVNYRLGQSRISKATGVSVRKISNINREILKKFEEINSRTDFSKYSLWMTWKRKCWKCGKIIPVAINTAGWDFNPFFNPSSEDGGMWSKKCDNKIEEQLKRMRIKREMRYSKTIGDAYMANICPFCNNIQGDGPLHEESIELITSGFSLPAQASVFGFFNDPKLLLFKEGELVAEYPDVSTFSRNYRKYIELK